MSDHHASSGPSLRLPRWAENGESPTGLLVQAGLSREKSGDVLLSQGVYPQVPSALTGLTSVFGMGTGVTLSLWSPKSCVINRPPDGVDRD